MCLVFIWEQKAICATYSINWLVFITEMKNVYSAVRSESLNKTGCASSLKCGSLAEMINLVGIVMIRRRIRHAVREKCRRLLREARVLKVCSAQHELVVTDFWWRCRLLFGLALQTRTRSNIICRPVTSGTLSSDKVVGRPVKHWYPEASMLKEARSMPSYTATSFQKWLLMNILKPSGHYMYHHFNIQQFYILPTLYLCVLCGSQNKQRLFPNTPYWFL